MRLSVVLESDGSKTCLQGEIDNLSTEGMRIRFAEEVDLPAEHEQLIVTFVLPLPTGPITVKSAVVYNLAWRKMAVAAFIPRNGRPGPRSLSGAHDLAFS